eukprot:scaffold115951_cov36-Tisochrysis_lutea.AAC.1
MMRNAPSNERDLTVMSPSSTRADLAVIEIAPPPGSRESAAPMLGLKAGDKMTKGVRGSAATPPRL